MCFSCRKIEKIEMAGNIKPKLVVNCLLNPGEGIVVHVTKSLSALDNARMKPVANARVILFKNNVLLDTLKYDAGNGVYFTMKEAAESGANYKVEVKASGMETVTATTFAPQPVNIANATLEVAGRRVDSSFYNGAWQYYGYFDAGKIRITFQDKPDEENHYMVQISEKWSARLGGQGYRYGSIYWVGDRLGLETVTDYRDGSTYFFFNDQLDNGKEITLELKTNYEFNQFRAGVDSMISCDVTMYSMSPDFSRHLYALKLWEQNDGNPFQEPVQVYTNIQGGYGIFGAKTESQKTIPFPY